MYSYLVIIGFLLIAISERGLAQTYMPLILNEQRDTLQYTWPIPDSLLCIKDEIIIKFKSSGLFLNKLCYDFEDSINPNLAVEGGEVLNYAYYERIMAMQQMFLLDSIIADPALLLSMKSLGGIYLTRISLADPCHDTLSITRFGDTIKSATYLYMKLKLNNDTSLINACIFLTYFHQNALDLAEPNYCYEFNRTPVDTYFVGTEEFDQVSLKEDQSNAQKAWDYQTGSKDIKVAVVDAGIDYIHCDLGGQYGEGKKVIDGFNYYIPDKPFNTTTNHGTQVASIIGALTNGATSGCPNSGIAGIAGGWMGDEGNPVGCSLIGLKISATNNYITQDKIAGAILDAAADFGERERSFDADIINCSWGGENYSELIRSALNFAYEHGVSTVCSKGNNYDGEKPRYPSCYDPNWITSVGAHEGLSPYKKLTNSNYGFNIDILAPGDAGFIVAAKPLGEWVEFGETSAAAPHVSGAIALLRSEFLNKTKYPDIVPEPEDYENILKIVAVDLNYDAENSDEKLRTKVGYDNVTGWGQLKIGEIFEKLAEGYRLYHYKIIDDQNNPYNYSDFSDELGGIVIAKNGKREDCEIGTYKSAKQRTVSGTIELSEEFLNNIEHKLYVWGRNGRTDKGGLDKVQFLKLPDDDTELALPLYLTSYTQLTSAIGGNDIVDGIIMPLNSRTVTAQTYQYKLKKDSQSEEMIVPTNENIELYFSVFGKKIPTSVNNGENEENSGLIFPNPANDYLEIGFNKKLKIADNTEINIYNVIGEIMVSTKYEDGINIRMNVAHLTPGIYFLKIGSHVEKFIKI